MVRPHCARRSLTHVHSDRRASRTRTGCPRARKHTRNRPDLPLCCMICQPAYCCGLAGRQKTSTRAQLGKQQHHHRHCRGGVAQAAFCSALSTPRTVLRASGTLRPNTRQRGSSRRRPLVARVPVCCSLHGRHQLQAICLRRDQLSTADSHESAACALAGRGSGA